MKYSKILAVFLLFFLFGNISYAKQPNRDKLLELAKITGLYEQIEQQKVAINEQGSKAANQYAQQLFPSFQEVPPEIKTIFEKEFETYMKNISNLIDTNFAVNAYIDLISKKLEDDEIDKIIAFYKSPVGKKYTQTNIALTPEWTKLLMANLDAKLMVHLMQFLKNLEDAIINYTQQN